MSGSKGHDAMVGREVMACQKSGNRSVAKTRPLGRHAAPKGWMDCFTIPVRSVNGPAGQALVPIGPIFLFFLTFFLTEEKWNRP